MIGWYILLNHFAVYDITTAGIAGERAGEWAGECEQQCGINSLHKNRKVLFLCDNSCNPD